MGRNNRRNLRVLCGVPAGAEGARAPISGTCRNLSQGGMFFIGPTLPVGQNLEFWIQLPGGKITATGEVRYAFAYPEGGGVGVRFTRLAQDGLAILNAFIAGSPEAA
ncbi:MAG: PilZ domain [Myxococcaceae bacterium]|nr:PilZ domain [Myxococcaceae bacterium]